MPNVAINANCTVLCLLINRPSRARLLHQAGLGDPRAELTMVVNEMIASVQDGGAPMDPRMRELTDRLVRMGRRA